MDLGRSYGHNIWVLQIYKSLGLVIITIFDEIISPKRSSSGQNQKFFKNLLDDVIWCNENPLKVLTVFRIWVVKNKLKASNVPGLTHKTYLRLRLQKLKMTINDQKWPNMTNNDQKWPKMTKDDYKMTLNKNFSRQQIYNGINNLIISWKLRFLLRNPLKLILG